MSGVFRVRSHGTLIAIECKKPNLVRIILGGLMKNLVIGSLCLGFALVFFGCSPISVRTDYDHEVDFRKYQTFKWMPYPEKRKKRGVSPNSLLDRRIRRAVERELEAKGYKLVGSGPADALLAYNVVVEKHVDVDHYGYGYGYWGRRTYVRRYKEGTIIIDVVDPELKQLVWRGAAQGLVGHPEGNEERINEAMFKVFEKYPPN